LSFVRGTGEWVVLEAEGEEGGVVFGNGDILSDKFIMGTLLREEVGRVEMIVRVTMG
jgi:hypothetical protein